MKSIKFFTSSHQPSPASTRDPVSIAHQHFPTLVPHDSATSSNGVVHRASEACLEDRMVQRRLPAPALLRRHVREERCRERSTLGTAGRDKGGQRGQRAVRLARSRRSRGGGVERGGRGGGQLDVDAVGAEIPVVQRSTELKVGQERHAARYGQREDRFGPWQRRTHTRVGGAP